MSLNKVKIFGIGVTSESKKNILEEVEKYLDKRPEKPLIIVTPNPEQAVLAQHDGRFREIVNRADVAIPDGIGLASVLGLKKISGVELMEDLVAMAAKQGDRVGLIGGRAGVAVDALDCLRRKYTGLEGWAMEPEGNTLDEISKKIVDTKTRIVFVGLGAPKQEYFIEEVKSQKSKVKSPLIFMSVGGSFDEISGRIPRSPKIIDRMGLKWLWRLVREPWRWRRQMALIKFIWMVIIEKIRDGIRVLWNRKEYRD